MKYLELPDYKIAIGPVRHSLKKILDAADFSKVVILADANSSKYCLPKIDFSDLPVICIPPGEVHKNIQTCQYIWQQMMDLGMDRHSLLINLGGGVVGDVGGFCAATFFRGVSFVQVPTTLLAQVDASIGGKLGVDFNFVKNALGVFKNPVSVLVDPDFLNTLPTNEMLSGFAEVIKHALIADKSLWNRLKILESFAEVDWEEILVSSLAIKRQVVLNDPFEKGLRKVLNFGHTIGHALESFLLSSGQKITHGETVAAGMIAESYLSYKYLGLKQEQLFEIMRLVRHWYSPIFFTENDFDVLLSLMKKDKKNRAGRISFTLLADIGEARYDQFLEEEAIKSALHFYLQSR